MKHSVKGARRPKFLCRARAYRPQLESLEARLPLGDAVLGAALGSSLLASSLTLREAWSGDSANLVSDTSAHRGQAFSGFDAVASKAMD